MQMDCRLALRFEQTLVGKNSLLQLSVLSRSVLSAVKSPMPIAATQTRRVPWIGIYRLFDPPVPVILNGPVGLASAYL